MAESAASSEATTAHVSHPDTADYTHIEKKPVLSVQASAGMDKEQGPASPGMPDPLAFSRNSSGHELDGYFTGPRDLTRHSKWPLFLRMQGSIIPKMLLPLFFVAGWATLITAISIKIHSLGVDSVLLTITGFVVSLGLSFRSSTAYERYAGGRQSWSQLVSASGILGRVFWIHATDQVGVDPRESMVKKMNSMNLVVAFAHALKHQLRFEPYTSHPDLRNLIGHLNTFANEATSAGDGPGPAKKKNVFKAVGEYLGISFAQSNPRKMLKQATQPLGNLPLEIITHLAVTVDTMVGNRQLDIALVQSQAYGALQTLHTVLTECDRVLNTPLPIAYSIAISQITWVYVLLLPFQLIPFLHWIAIPATVAASYIILGLLMIGQEIENPFGSDVNDLPLDGYCEQIANDMDVIASYDKRLPPSFLMEGRPLYPISMASAATWAQMDEGKLRDAIRSKHNATFMWRRGTTKMGAAPTPGDHNV